MKNMNMKKNDQIFVNPYEKKCRKKEYWDKKKKP